MVEGQADGRTDGRNGNLRGGRHEKRRGGGGGQPWRKGAIHSFLRLSTNTGEYWKGIRLDPTPHTQKGEGPNEAGGAALSFLGRHFGGR